MKILVTGGAGFIGTALIKKLLKEGHQVISIDDYSIGLKDNHIEGCEYFDGKVEHIEKYSKLNINFDLVYHLAALSRIQPSFNNPDETFRVNTIGTQKVLEWARYKNTKVVYAGSSSRWHNPYQSPYAACKHIGEEACKMYKKTYGMDIEIVRFYNVYGPGEIIDGDWAAVIGKWRRQVRDGELITIVGNGEQRRDFTYIDDIIDGLWKIGIKNVKHEDAWELGTGNNYSINQIYGWFKEKFYVGSINIPEQSGNYKETIRENDDSLKQLNWKPTDQLKKYIFSL